MASKFAPSGSFLDGPVFRLPTTSILEDQDRTVSPWLLETMATPLTLSSAARFCMAASAWSATVSNVFMVLMVVSLGWVWLADAETSRDSCADKLAMLMHNASAGKDMNFANADVL